MDKNHFKVIKKANLDEVKLGDTFPESDFSCLSKDGNFVQLEYVEVDTKQSVPVTPGIWKIKKGSNGLKLETTEFTQESILPIFTHTTKVIETVDKFFSRLHIYKKHNIEVPKRSLLLYGGPGGGKSTSIRVIAEKYAKDAAVILWSTDNIEAYDVKEFIKRFEYDGVTKLILVAEDIGGVEIDEVKVQSDSSLLALLDNTEKAFKIATAIISTTNFPEIFLGNLTNRPGRIDVKIEVKDPNAEERKQLLNFFLQQTATSKQLEEIEKDHCKGFSIAHIKEVTIRADLEEITIEQSINLIAEDIKHYKNLFQQKKKLGIQNDF